jgi:putative holliday junction resolvase
LLKHHNRMPTAISTILALDVGDKRIGVAQANTVARLASPLMTLTRGDDIIEQLKYLIAEQGAEVLVVGLPRGMQSQSTQQTQATEAFVKVLKAQLTVPIFVQDEAVTSEQAEAELKAHGTSYSKADIDALAATYILEDWLREHHEFAHG